MECESGLLAVLMVTLIDALCSLTDPLLRLFLFTELSKLNEFHFFVCNRQLFAFFLVTLFISFWTFQLQILLSSWHNHFQNHQASLSFTMRAQKSFFTKQFICGARNNLLVNLQFIHFSLSPRVVVGSDGKAAAKCHYNFINFSPEMINLRFIPFLFFSSFTFVGSYSMQNHI